MSSEMLLDRLDILFPIIIGVVGLIILLFFSAGIVWMCRIIRCGHNPDEVRLPRSERRPGCVIDEHDPWSWVPESND